MKKILLTSILFGCLMMQTVAQVSVSLPDLTTSIPPGTIVEIPVTVENLTGLNVIAYQFLISFDNSIIVPESPYYLSTGTLSSTSGWSVMANPNIPNKLTIGAFGSSPLSGNGTLVKLTFKVMTAVGSSPLTFNSFLFNAGNPASITTNGSFTNQVCTETQTLVIPSGWSGISTFIDVSNPDMVSMFSPIVNNLLMVRNNENSYSPPNGITPTQQWDTYSGYFIKLNEPELLSFCGQELQNRSLTLDAGWNLMPVLNNCIYFCEEILYGLDYEFVQAAAGLDVYWPSKSIQTLYFFEPGKAYLIKMNSPGVVTFSDCK